MAQTTQQDPIAHAYATSLLELASESGSEVAIGEEIEGLSQILAENKSFVLYLKDPGVSIEERERTLRQTFTGRVSQVLLNTILVMNHKGRIAHLPAFCDAYDALLDEKLGKVEVDVTVASRLSNEELENVRQLVNRALKKDAVVHQYIDESIIGGLILKVGDRLIDGSVKTQLDQIKTRLTARK